MKKITAGDSASFPVHAPGHPATDGWVLSSFLRGPVNLPLTVETDADGKQRAILTAAQSATLKPGVYARGTIATKGDERATLPVDRLQITPDLADADSAYVAGTPDEIALAAVDAALAGRANKAQEEMSFDGLSVKNTSVDDLKKLRVEFVRRINLANRRRRGAPAFGLIEVKFR